MGGSVAFEIAQQLQRQGHKVSLLALIDSKVQTLNGNPADLTHPNISDYSDTKILVNFFQDLAFSAGKQISYNPSQQLNADDLLNYLLHQAQAAGLMPLDAGEDQLRYLFKVFKGNIQAMLNYSPKVYPDQVVLFQASVRNDYVNDESIQNWNQLSSKPVKIHTVPGDHYTMLSKSNVQILAEKLMIYLDAVRSEIA